MAVEAGPSAPPKPGAGTAVAAGVLAIAGGLWFLAGIFWLAWLSYGWIPALLPSQATDAVVGLVLLTGGVLLLARRGEGRVLSIAGAVLGLVAPIVGTVLLYQRILVVVGGPTGIDSLVPRRIVVAVPFAALLVLAALPATRRWTRR